MVVFSQEVLDLFRDLLQERLRRSASLTEDEIQNSLNFALVAKGAVAEYEIRMEFEHPNIPGKKLDSYIAPDERHRAAAWEVKYDRRPPGGKNQARSEKAGALINDVLRLAAMEQEKELERVFVYVTDPEMAGYYRSPANRFGTFFDLPRGGHFAIEPDWVASLSPSVQRRVKTLRRPCRVNAEYSAELPSDHSLRIYTVVP